MKYKLVCALILLVSCLSKDPKPVEKLPELTTEGKNTFGCLVNGKVWIPKFVCKSWIVCGHRDLTVRNIDLLLNLSMTDTIRKDTIRNVFWINAHRVNQIEDVNESVGILINNVTCTGFYNLFIMKNDYGPYNSYYSLNNTEYSFGSENSTVEILKLDTLNRIISGKFEFITQDNNYRLTNGIFDLRYVKNN